jgi:hypothetical protein
MQCKPTTRYMTTKSKNTPLMLTFITHIHAIQPAHPTTIPANHHHHHRPFINPTPLELEPAFVPGNPFATLAVCVPLAKQLAVPQEYPLGQHPSPRRSLSHRNQPLAQLPLPLVPDPVGTRTVTPLLCTTVVCPRGGHDDTAQSRPVWQQPAPAVARQG